MRLKYILTITLLLTLIAVVLVLLEQRTEPIDPEDRYPRPLIADPEVFENTNRLVLRKSALDSGILVMVRDGGRRWHLEDHHAIPVRPSAMQRLSRKLGEARLVRFVTQNPEEMKRLGIGEQELRMMEVDRELVRIQLGEPSSPGGQPVSLDGEKVHLLSESLEWSTDPAAWWENQVLFPLGEEDIKAFTLKWPDGSTLHADRASAHDLFSVSEGEGKDNFDTARARRLLRNLLAARIEGAHLRDAEVVRAASETSFALELETFFGSTAELRLMRRPARDEVVEPAETAVSGESNDEVAALFQGVTARDAERGPFVQRTPAGPVIATYRGDALEAEWQTPTENAAFVLRDSIWNQLPQSVETFFLTEE